MLLIQHTRCAEHGELIHGGEAHHHEGLAHVETDAVAFESASTGASDEGHGHCALTVDRRDAPCSITEAQISQRLIEAPEQHPSTDAFVFVEANRFRVAPKNSPPA